MTDTQTLQEQAEQCVIGSLLLDNQSLYRMGFLEDVDFSYPLHRQIYLQSRDIIHGGGSVDSVTVRSLVEGDEDWLYLCELVRNTPSAKNAPEYAKLLRRGRMRKRAASIGRQLHEDMAALEEPEETISEAQVNLSRVLVRDRADLSYSDACALLDARLERDDSAISTGIPTLDGVLGGGLQATQLYVVGARPGCFKSAWAQKIAMRACADGHQCGVINLEMSASEIAFRGRKQGYGSQSTIRLDCESYDIDAISARISEWKHQHGVSIVVVDYLQLISSKGRSRYEQLCDVSRRLKLLAKQFELAILAPAQLSREVEREKRQPRLSDLRECGNIEQDADVVLFMHKDKNDQYSLIVAKQRGGLAGCRPIPLVVDGPRFTVREGV